jgi:type IV secretory pathway TraG/TraD family ATPase VirD4
MSPNENTPSSSSGAFLEISSRGVEARMSTNDDVVLGARDLWGEEHHFSLSSSDRRHHLYVIGKSGTGKTTLLRNLILQDIEAGRGVAVIDPHGDLALDILDHIPRRRIEDVSYFDPADAEYPVGFNLVGQVPPERRHLVASGIVSAFKGIWSDFWGPRLEYILYAAVAALLDCENVSLLGVPRMLSDARYRAWVVKQIKDPVVRSFWENEFERYDRKFLLEAIAPIQNKVGQLLMSPHVRNILGQVRSRVDARFMMDRGRVFIVNLSKGALGADKANLLGALWVTQFQLAAMSRADVPEEDRRDFYLYVDEFHSFTSDSFAAILSEARKYRLCLTLSHQYLRQLRPSISDAVMGNVGSLVAFRVGHEDAEALQKAFGDTYAASHFAGLGNREVYAKLLSDGQDIEPFMGRTLPPCGKRHDRREVIVRRSREKYAASRSAIEERIQRWLG